MTISLSVYFVSFFFLWNVLDFVCFIIIQVFMYIILMIYVVV